MHNKIKIVYWNAQGLGKKRTELLQLFTQLKIDIILINETHLTSKNTFNLPHFKTYRNDRITPGRTNSGGTAILIRHNIAQLPLQINTYSLENTIIHININGTDLR